MDDKRQKNQLVALMEEAELTPVLRSSGNYFRTGNPHGSSKKWTRT